MKRFGALVLLVCMGVGVPPHILRAADAVSGTPATPEATVMVPNAAPEVRTIVLSNQQYGSDDFVSGITPSVGVSRRIYVTGVAEDINGDTTIATTSVVMYRTSKTNACTASMNNCYKNVVCTISTAYGSTLEAAYSCPIDIAYFADATGVGGRYVNDDWTAYVTITDSYGLVATSTKTVEVNSLLALSIPDTITYGVLNLGEETDSATNHEMVITQKGNTRADVDVSGGDMACALGGNIPVSNQRFNNSDIGYASSTKILSSTSAAAGINVVWQESDTVLAMATLYWNIKIPGNGVQGTCTGTNIISVRAAANQGVLFDSQVGGVTYTSRSFSGETDSEGRFLYMPGEDVTFSAGGAVIGTISVVPQDGYVFLQDIVGVTRDSISDDRVVRLARFLQSLDVDNNPDNKIQIPPGVQKKITEQFSIQQADDTMLAKYINLIYSGRKLTTKGAALQHLRQSLKEI